MAETICALCRAVNQFKPTSMAVKKFLGITVMDLDGTDNSIT